MRVKSWTHTGLAVRNLDEAIRFYCAAFNYEVMDHTRGMTEPVAAVTGIAGQSCDLAHLKSSVSDHVLELVQFHGHEGAATPQPESPLRPGQAHVAFIVDDLDAALAKVQALGARRLGSRFAVLPGYRSAYLTEPSGTFFELEEISGE